MAHIIAVMNQKGGVGKTTTAVNLSSYLAIRGRKVLLVDMDPQGNATCGVGISPGSVELTVYDSLVSGVEFVNVIHPTSYDNLHIVPANQSLAGAEIELISVVSRETILKNILNKFREPYDYIIIDCPPSLGLLTVNSLVAADGIIIPLQCEYYALEGISYMFQTVDLIKENFRPDLSIIGVLFTMFDKRTNLNQQVVDEVKKHYSGHIFKTMIPRSVRLSEAPSHGLPIALYSPDSAGALAYDSFAGELLNLLEPIENPDLTIVSRETIYDATRTS